MLEDRNTYLINDLIKRFNSLKASRFNNSYKEEAQSIKAKAIIEIEKLNLKSADDIFEYSSELIGRTYKLKN